jgi:hypothetical protein
MRERGLEKLAKSLLKVGFTARTDAAGDGDVDGSVHGVSKLEKKGEGRGKVIHVTAARGMHIGAGEEMNVRGLNGDVPLELPGKVYVKRGGDVIGSISESGNGHEAGHAINRIAA